MSTLSYRPVKNIGYTPPQGYKFEYSKFETKDVELEDNEIEASSEEDEDEDRECDDEYEVPSECVTTDDSSSEISECDIPILAKKRSRKIPEKVYSVVLQEEDFLPE